MVIHFRTVVAGCFHQFVQNRLESISRCVKRIFFRSCHSHNVIFKLISVRTDCDTNNENLFVPESFCFRESTCGFFTRIPRPSWFTISDDHNDIWDVFSCIAWILLCEKVLNYTGNCKRPWN